METEILDPEDQPMTSVVRRAPAAVEVASELTVDELIGRMAMVQDAMKRAMKDGVHYGVIPGTPKPTLFKPGAETLCSLFRLAPTYDVHETQDGDHYTVRATCTLIHGPSGTLVASGEGLCTTKEKRYAYRKGERVCPECGKAAIIKGKEEYGGGWLCFRKKDGCGAKWSDESDQGRAFAEQVVDDIDNPDLPDLYNTVLKMACKRALVAAVLNGTAASDIFTQDVEDLTNPAAPRGDTGGVGSPVAPPAKGSPDNLAALKAEIARLSPDQPDIWGEDAILQNASRQFGRGTISKLEDLTDREMLDIIKAAADWTSFTYDTKE